MSKTPKKSERGLCELYEQDPERADALVFGRIAKPNRRGFLKGAGLAAMGAALGGAIPFHRNMPAGLIPAAWAEEGAQEAVALGEPLANKSGLTILNDRPINAETPAHLLDDEVTPIERHFVRNNGQVPDIATSQDASSWQMVIDGEVGQPLTLTLEDLRNDFENVTYALQLECGGNGRAGFNPPASGNQWTVGAIGNSRWTGVRLADLLKAAGLRDTARYTGHYGLDPHLSGDPNLQPISRGMPIDKAMDPYTIVAFAMNERPIHPLNGFPVRLVAPGWAGSVSQKWLSRIQIRPDLHDGAKMAAPSYQMPIYPVSPGQEVPLTDYRIITAMPVKSLISYPQSGIQISRNQPRLEVRGHAWAGDQRVAEMHVSKDFGATWQKAELMNPPNPFSWQRWRADVDFPQSGYYEIWARATDANGNSQPFIPPWNPRGYLNNAMHRIALRVT